VRRPAVSALDARRFPRSNAIPGPLFEATFAAACTIHDRKRFLQLNTAIVEALKIDETFQGYAQQQTTNAANVLDRRRRALELLGASR
jgi:hypothetical protein